MDTLNKDISGWEQLRIEELYRKLETEPFYIYGTGVISERFYMALNMSGRTKHLLGFIVSKKSQDDYHGKPVFEVGDAQINNSYLICIAVHETNLKDLLLALDNIAANNRIWVYPCLLQLELGNPVESGVTRDVKKLVANQKFLIPYAIYYLAIEDIDLGNGIGKEAYLWLYMRANTLETSQKRLNRLQKLFNDFNHDRYDDFPIRVGAGGDLVADGAHRLMLARYFEIPEILCDVYQFDSERFLDRMKWFFVTEEELKERFSEKEYEQIQHVIHKLKNA